VGAKEPSCYVWPSGSAEQLTWNPDHCLSVAPTVIRDSYGLRLRLPAGAEDAVVAPPGSAQLPRDAATDNNIRPESDGQSSRVIINLTLGPKATTSYACPPLRFSPGKAKTARSLAPERYIDQPTQNTLAFRPVRLVCPRNLATVAAADRAD
jgi:hypothetical protein